MNKDTALSDLPVTRVALVVEDDVLVRLSAGEDLREAGFEVIEAASADEALSLLAAGLHVDMIFSDVNMPGSLDGLGLLDAVRSLYPSVVRLLTSGVTRFDGEVPGRAAAFLPKPYTRSELPALVERHVRPGEAT